ncbi:hypothetical protein KFE98_16490 [bacterium SCSIO 12741]|nr:hypothetical protein KFE98_16490 [bacterium SCSIO 12741]
MKISSLFVLLFLLSGSAINAQTYREYYPNGTVKLEGDTFNGAFTYFYESGEVFLTGFTRRGVKDSIWNYYNEQKLLSMREVFRGGQMAVKRTWKYYPDGQLGEDLKLTYLRASNGGDSTNITREWKFWYENGEPAADLIIINNQDMGSSYWNRKGEVIRREDWLIEMRMEAENK